MESLIRSFQHRIWKTMTILGLMKTMVMRIIPRKMKTKDLSGPHLLVTLISTQSRIQWTLTKQTTIFSEIDKKYQL